MPKVVLKEFRESADPAYPEAEIVKCNEIMVELRKIKSVNELACIQEGFRIIDIATDEVIRHLKPGVTELQMVGIAQKVIYEEGAEYEGLPMYVFSQESTRHAISLSTYKTIKQGDIVQLNLSAKIDGYSPATGIPVVMGKLYEEKGFKDNFVYGPCHGTGMIEVEAPWREIQE